MVTRWSQKSPGLKILWIWTLGTAASNELRHFPSSNFLFVRTNATGCWLLADLNTVVIGGVVRMRVNDMQKILREEEEAAAATSAATAASNERVLKDDD
ncbi:hypothetical protein PR202_ga18716 [Eleusine coracana subsp. coracana]|uniref:Uncharacterized protein n=1 Tax=Eleusine coracana subsp. coracana TaxID=191504 RepID=A0AAV5CSQ9_ELECO|nr:hypothetical protein PR202_ga18716 [Eleusine coracana subsp. coracana]